MNTDFDIDSSLDVAISMFSMVGGQQHFLEVCGGSMNSNTNHVFSMKNAKALEVQTTLHKISSSLKDLEANIIRDNMLNAYRSEDEEFVKSSSQALADLSDRMLEMITTNLLKQSNSECGVIIWLNPGVCRNIFPEPIRLRETLQYLYKNASFSSTGYDIFDIVDISCERTRFKIIEERIKQAQVTQSSMRGVVKRLDTSNIEALYKVFFPRDDIKLCHDIQTSKIDAIQDIEKTAKKIFSDIVNQRMFASDTSGMLQHLYNNEFHTSYIACN
jgi:hypothetical protein